MGLKAVAREGHGHPKVSSGADPGATDDASDSGVFLDRAESDDSGGWE
jgi:hypothetical protein